MGSQDFCSEIYQRARLKECCFLKIYCPRRLIPYNFSVKCFNILQTHSAIYLNPILQYKYSYSATFVTVRAKTSLNHTSDHDFVNLIDS